MKQFFNKHPTFKKIFLICLTFVVMTSFMVIPSSAEDLDENVTNLLGTTWIIDSWNTLPANGSYDVMGVWATNPYTDSKYSFSNIALGFMDPPYRFDPETNEWVADPHSIEINCIWVESPGLNANNGIAMDAGFSATFTFTGGSDCTNPLLISFFAINGRRVPAFPEPSPSPDPEPNYTVPVGWYFSDQEIPFLQRDIDFDLSFNTMGRSFTYIICNGHHMGFDSLTVCNSDGWLNYGYRLIFVTQTVTLEPSEWEWFFSVYNSTVDGTSSGYQRGLADGKIAGYGEGFTDGLAEGETLGYEVGFDEGYRVGYEVGFADNTGGGGGSSEDSANLGKNLLGDTLSAPMRALNNFVLYESDSGFEVTLGGVVGASICLTLFISFLKIFAGG